MKPKRVRDAPGQARRAGTVDGRRQWGRTGAACSGGAAPTRSTIDAGAVIAGGGRTTAVEDATPLSGRARRATAPRSGPRTGRCSASRWRGLFCEAQGMPAEEVMSDTPLTIEQVREGTRTGHLRLETWEVWQQRGVVRRR